MSMISSQCDELRDYASRADGTFPLLASALRDAADLILELRDDLQQANAENAQLRDEFRKMDQWHSAELMAALAENAKLRELVKYAHDCAIHSDHATCDDCERMNEGCILVGRMRELGVEL